MAKLFIHYHCNVVITDWLRSIFSSKLMRMGKAMQTCGGKERTMLLTKWKESKWVLEFKENEFIVPNRKRKPDNPIIQSCKRQYETLEQTIKDTNRKLKDLTNELEAVKKSNKKLSKALNNKSKSRTPKPWSELSTQYHREKRSSFQQMFLHPIYFLAG